jgi:hypothetical protein
MIGILPGGPQSHQAPEESVPPPVVVLRAGRPSDLSGGEAQLMASRGPTFALLGQASVTSSHQNASISVAEWLHTGRGRVFKRARRAQFTCQSVVDRSGFEPLTPALHLRRAKACRQGDGREGLPDAQEVGAGPFGGLVSLFPA